MIKRGIKMKKIMFVCTGNICRSAMAHRMLEKYINDKNKQNENVFRNIYILYDKKK